MGNYFKLIRWKNLVLIAYFYVLIKFLVFPSYELPGILTYFQYTLLLVSVLCIAAAGYIINDVFDIEADLINKPSKTIITKTVSIEKAKNWYKFTNLTGLSLGILLSIQISKPTFSLLFIGTSILLFLYSKKFKKKGFIGNLIIAFLTSFSVYIIAIFELHPIRSNENEELVYNLILVLALFSFLINLLRELIKDIEDINGDYKINAKTIPIVLGRKRATFIASIICIIPITVTLFIILNIISDLTYLKIYVIVTLFLPLLFVFSKLKKASKKKEFKQISNTLKMILFFGINTLLIVTLFN